LNEYYKTSIQNVFQIKSIVTVIYINSYEHVPGESHDFTELLYVDKGNHSLEIDGVPYQLKEGQMIFFPPNSYHYGPVTTKASLAIVSFETESTELSCLYNQIITLTSSQKEFLSDIISNINLFQAVPKGLDKIGKMPNEDVTQGQLQILKNLLEIFLITLLQTNKNTYLKPKNINSDNYNLLQLETIKSYLKQSLNLSLTLDEISYSTGISTSKIKRLFKEYDNTTPIAYYSSLKIDEAKKLIRKSPMNFTEIAEHLGFESVHYFSKFFKKQTGLTPSEFSKTVHKTT
jgi:AraC-like DNA-binding protein